MDATISRPSQPSKGKVHLPISFHEYCLLSSLHSKALTLIAPDILRAQGIVPSQELPNLLPPATGRQQAITVDAESTAGPSEQQRTSTPDRDMKSGIIVIDAEEDIQQDTTIGAGPVTGPSEQPRVSTRRQPHVLTHDVDMDTSERPHASAPDVEMEPNVDVVEKEEVEDVDMLKVQINCLRTRCRTKWTNAVLSLFLART